MRNKSIIISFCLSILSASAVWAQKPFPKEHSLGVNGGVVLSKMTFQPQTIVQDFRLGPTFGITYRYIEEKYFGIQAELLFTQRGWKDKLEDYPDLYFERSLNYVELPILSHIFFGNNRVRGFVNLGPKFAFFLGDAKKGNIPPTIEGLETAHQELEVTKKVDYGITGGAGIELRFGRNSILLEGRYYFGLGDIFPNEKKDVFDTSSNQNIAITATYLFHFKRKK